MSNLYKLLIFAVVLSVLLVNAEAASDKTSLDVKSRMLKGEKVHIIVILKEKPSLNAFSKENAVPLLKRHATNSQSSIASLITEEKTKGNADKIKQFWVVNAISLHASPEFIERLAKRDDIVSVELDSEFVVKEDYFAQISGSSIYNATSEIIRINAPKAWELGITGSGINVSIIDTGINPSHPDIAGRVIRWVDLVGSQPLPYDDFGHGTHVAGTVAGNGIGGTTTGLAPDANLFGVKVLDGTGSGYESNIINGIQWSIDNKADIISMSLGTNEIWTSPNCDVDNPAMAIAINNAINAGIVVVAAAGNSASGVSSPGCIGGAIAVGAVDSSDTIASFSGRGNAMADHGLVAPGYSITSLNYQTSGYTIYSGTSMATPHVSGTVADLLNAARNKGFILSPAQVRSILENTSVDLGTAGKDNIYGAGRIDVFEAIREYSIYTINGTVIDNTSRTGIANVIVTTNTGISTVTNASGFYSLTVLAGTYDLRAIFDPIYYTNNTITTSTIGKMFVEQDIELLKKPTGTITGNITKV
jgi:serine protease AprX